jgi:hypothetical protein
MIVFQSPPTGVAESPSVNQRSTAGMSSPGGSNERRECRFVCCSGVETDSSEHGERHFLCCSFVGELINSGRQSALICLLDSNPVQDCLCRPFCPNIVFFTSVPSVPLWLNSLFWILEPANPNPKSTAGSPKSTVDLRLEPLIWGKNGLQTPFCRAFGVPFAQ